MQWKYVNYINASDFHWAVLAIGWPNVQGTHIKVRIKRSTWQFNLSWVSWRLITLWNSAGRSWKSSSKITERPQQEKQLNSIAQNDYVYVITVSNQTASERLSQRISVFSWTACPVAEPNNLPHCPTTGLKTAPWLIDSYWLLYLCVASLACFYLSHWYLCT